MDAEHRTLLFQLRSEYLTSRIGSVSVSSAHMGKNKLGIPGYSIINHVCDLDTVSLVS